MNRNNLVVLKSSKELKLGSNTLLPNKYYRCLKETENDNEAYFVYGIKMNKEFFEFYFEYAYDRIMRDWETIGLTVNGKPINKTTFGKLANIHTYGKQTNNLRIIFFGHPKECLYGFYPPLNENKVKQLDHMFTWYKEVINCGEFAMSYFDNDSIQFGNAGIPICFGDLRTY